MAKDKASAGEASSIVERGRSETMSSAVSGSGAEDDDVLGKEFLKAAHGGNFEWLNRNQKSWERRRDLFDDVVAKSGDVIVWLIQRAEITKEMYLLHSLIREKG